ncbi:pentapeptide repeat-containing protein [Amycolatopsis sp. NPDC059657]|uniref:pentapeptide repeat-containing protein n=1 Tax=Amycolatopsis sp. NPDC059657 TaxID=3346899 RepID=UPI00366B3D06
MVDHWGSGDDVTEPAASSAERHAVSYTVLSVRAIWAAAVVIVLLGAGVAVWLLLAYGHGDAQQRNQLEAIKTAGTIVVGTGGAAALLLAARRQRSAEIALKQKDLDQLAVERTHALQERMAADTRLDAGERRLTELYTKAVDQLGSDKIPVQLGGLYALERLAQDNVGQRQTIVNVLCAYLRMFTDAADDVTADHIDGHRLQRERRARQAAAVILRTHLRPDDGERFWRDMDLDLSGASVLEFDLSQCRVRSATFRAATFVGDALFGSTAFGSDVTFALARFTGTAEFAEAVFEGSASFESATFSSDAAFTAAVFTGKARFDSAIFSTHARFESAMFTLGEAPRQVPFDKLPSDIIRTLTALPALVPYADIVPNDPEQGSRLVPFGIGDQDGQPVCWRFDNDPHFVAFMGAESGKTNLLRTIVRGIADRHSPTEAVIIVVDFRRTMTGYLGTEHLLGYAVAHHQLSSMISDVRDSLEKRLPGPDVTAEQLRDRSWWNGPELFIVVDDYDTIHHRGLDPLEPLCKFVPQAKDVGLHIVLARTTEGAGSGTEEATLNALLDCAAPGLVGNGDLHEGPLLRSVWPSALMPGRAVAVDRLNDRQLVQIAWSEPD